MGVNILLETVPFVTDLEKHMLHTGCIYGSVSSSDRIQVWYRYVIRVCNRYVVIHTVYRLYLQVCTVMYNTGIYGTDILYTSVTDVLSYVLYTSCIKHDFTIPVNNTKSSVTICASTDHGELP